MSNIRIIKARAIGEDSVAIEYMEKTAKTDWGKKSIDLPEKARPEFYSSLAALAEHVVDLCEFPTGYLDTITVKGATFNYKGPKGLIGATIVAQRKLEHANSPLHIATPFKFERDMDVEMKGDSLIFLSTECADDLKVFRQECKKFIKGFRAEATPDLFDAGDGTSAIVDDSDDSDDQSEEEESSSVGVSTEGKIIDLPDDVAIASPHDLDVKKVSSKKAPYKK